MSQEQPQRPLHVEEKEQNQNLSPQTAPHFEEKEENQNQQQHQSSAVSNKEEQQLLSRDEEKQKPEEQNSVEKPQEIDVKPEELPEQQDEPIKYGDVFPVRGQLADEVIKPQDAAMMQSAENLVLGQTQKGGIASVLQSAADRNEKAGHVSHDESSPLPADRGVSVAETDVPGAKVITESVAGQVVGQFVQPTPLPTEAADLGVGSDPSLITIGEALEATAMSAADKPIDKSDAAAIMAAEKRATGRSTVTPGSVASEAQAAADTNEKTENHKEKTTLGDVLADATLKLPADKVVTVEDAQKVINAEIRNAHDTGAHPGGVAASVAAAARLNLGDAAV